MPQLHGPEDVHRIMVERAKHSWLLGLVAFGIFEDRRFDWMRHFTEHKQRLPTDEEISSWYEQQSPRVVDDIIADAENSLKIYGEEVLEHTIEDLRRETATGVIVDEIRLSRNFWAQLGVNVLGGILSAFIFAAILVILVVIIFSDPSPVKMMQDYMSSSTKGSSNGTEGQ